MTTHTPGANHPWDNVSEMTRRGCAWRLVFLLLCGAGIYLLASSRNDRRPATAGQNMRRFDARGIVKKIEAKTKILVIAHDSIGSYMTAMTMPFRVRSNEELRGLAIGDSVEFRLNVTDVESWIDRVVKIAPARNTDVAKPAVAPKVAPVTRPLASAIFTNEFGQPVALRSFRGQAVAITFFFTRCPVPDFCPRLSRNFAEASQLLAHSGSGLTNWHFLSVSIDPAFDNPALLKAYGQRYEYDPAHWSFLTGKKEDIAALARAANVEFESEAGTINHNFRTLIINAAGRLQMVFPTGGNLSKDIAVEMLKAAAVERTKQS